MITRRISKAGAAKALVELTVIVVGILLALWADATWEARQAVAEEESYLRALRSDFEQLRSDAASRISDYQGWITSMEQLLAPSIRSASPDSVNKLLATGLFQINEFEAPMSTLDDLMSSGRLSVLTSRMLRGQLASFLRSVEELEELESELATVQFERVDPFLLEFGDIGLIGRQQGLPESVPMNSWDASGIFRAAGFQNLVNLKILTVASVRNQLSVVSASGEAVLVTVEEQLDPEG